MILTVEMQLIGEKILYNVFHLVNISFPFFFYMLCYGKNCQWLFCEIDIYNI